MFCALIRYITFFRRPTSALGYMNVILLCSNHLHFLATHGHSQGCENKNTNTCWWLPCNTITFICPSAFLGHVKKKIIHFIKYLTCYSSHLDICKKFVFTASCVLLNSLATRIKCPMWCIGDQNLNESCSVRQAIKWLLSIHDLLACWASHCMMGVPDVRCQKFEL